MSKDSLKVAVERVAKRATKQFAKRGKVLPVYLRLDGRGQEFVFSVPPGLTRIFHSARCTGAENH